MKTFSLIIFDCDGVLIESEILTNRIEVATLQELGHDIHLEEYIDISVGKHSDAITRILAQEKNIILPQDFWKRVEALQARKFETDLKAVKGIKEVLSKLTLPKCVASASSVQRLQQTLTLTELIQFFPDRVFSCDLVPFRKPAPDIYLYAAEKMGVKPQECLVIEDSLTGVEAGLKAGMEVWGYCGGEHITPNRRKALAASGVSKIFSEMQHLIEIFKKG